MNSSGGERVILGFSGGIDSTASCIKLQERGFDVTGLLFYFDKNSYDASVPGAEKAAKALDIDLETVDASDAFEKYVVEPFCRMYSSGRTPSPCILCNPAVKFALLGSFAENIGADYIATGHYAGLEKDADGAFWIRRSRNLKKDQSYMLSRLSQDILGKLILPVGDEPDKNALRKLLEERNIPNFSQKDSQDICFIPEGDYVSFLKKRGMTSKEGFFISEEGKVIGSHRGIMNYTVGQRKGLGVALGKPVFVSEINENTGNIILGGPESLLHKNVIVNQLHFPSIDHEHAKASFSGKKLSVKLRYTPREGIAEIDFIDNDRAVLHFDEPQRAPAPGQAAVFYDKDRVLGCGFIEIAF